MNAASETIDTKVEDDKGQYIGLVEKYMYLITGTIIVTAAFGAMAFIGYIDTKYKAQNIKAYQELINDPEYHKIMESRQQMAESILRHDNDISSTMLKKKLDSVFGYAASP